MPISKETVERIINFCPDKGGDLGEIDGGLRLVYGVFPYQQRVAVLPGEPLVPTWTRQPALALESRGEDGRVTDRRLLVYTTDVKALGADLAVEVLIHLATIQRRRQVSA